MNTETTIAAINGLPDDPCRCGHVRAAHPASDGRCRENIGLGFGCPCEYFYLPPPSKPTNAKVEFQCNECVETIVRQEAELNDLRQTVADVATIFIRICATDGIHSTRLAREWLEKHPPVFESIQQPGE